MQIVAYAVRKRIDSGRRRSRERYRCLGFDTLFTISSIHQRSDGHHRNLVGEAIDNVLAGDGRKMDYGD